MAGGGEPILGSLYVYAPNKAAPIFFTIAYAITAILHIWQCYHYKSWKIVGLHPLCTILFTIGYASRIYGSYNYMYLPYDKKPLGLFIMSQICIFVGPPFLELANYHVLGRVFHYIPYAAPLNPSRVTAFFGGLMALIEGLNGAGVALAANAKAKEASKKAGHNLILVALALQVIVIMTFSVLSTIFHRRYRKARISAPEQLKGVSSVMLTLYLSMTLIFVRCVYRLVENATGTTSVDLKSMAALRKLSPILRYEVYFYVFEASLMLVNSFLWNARHPGPHLPRDSHATLAQDGSEVPREKDAAEHHPIWLQMLNVLAFGLLLRGSKRNSNAHSLELEENPMINGHNKAGLGHGRHDS